MKVPPHIGRGHLFGGLQAILFILLYILFPPSRNRSEREVRAAALVLQTIWGYKELRKPLEKEGWKKSDFQVSGC